MKIKNKTGIIGIIITIIILIALIIFTNIKTNKFYFIENGISKLINPIQNSLILLKNKIENNEGFFIDLNKLKDKNEELVEENKILKQKLEEIEVLKAENNNYRKYLNLNENYNSFDIVPAYIVNEDCFNYNYNIIINVGKGDGVEENMVVVNEDGVVGHIISVGETTAKVKTLVDTSSFISASINDINNSVVCNGLLNNRDHIKAVFIETNQTLVVGDIVQTNGIGGIYPKGLNIGVVEEIVDTKNITDRYAYVKTSVDFNNLNYLAVIKNK